MPKKVNVSVVDGPSRLSVATGTSMSRQAATARVRLISHSGVYGDPKKRKSSR